MAGQLNPGKAATMTSPAFRLLLLPVLLLGASTTVLGGSDHCEIPKSIRAIMEKPRYSEATWALRVVDVKSGAVIYDLDSQERLLTGSVRKLYSVGETLNQFGPDYRFNTPVYRKI